MKYVAIRADKCRPDAIVVPFIDEDDVRQAAADMNNGEDTFDRYISGKAAQYGDMFVVAHAEDGHDGPHRYTRDHAYPEE